MVEYADASGGIRGGIRQYEVKFVRRKTEKKLLGSVLVTLDLDSSFQGEGGFQDAVRDQFWNKIGYSHDQPHRPIARTAFENIRQLASERENFFGIAEDDLPGIGQHEPPALARK